MPSARIMKKQDKRAGTWNPEPKPRKPKEEKTQPKPKKAKKPAQPALRLSSYVMRMIEAGRFGDENVEPTEELATQQGFVVTGNTKDLNKEIRYSDEAISFLPPSKVCPELVKILKGIGFKVYAAKARTYHDDEWMYDSYRIFITEQRRNVTFKYVDSQAENNIGYGDSVRTLDAVATFDIRTMGDSTYLIVTVIDDRRFKPSPDGKEYVEIGPNICANDYLVDQDEVSLSETNDTVMFSKDMLYSIRCALRDYMDYRLTSTAKEFFSGSLCDMFVTERHRG